MMPDRTEKTKPESMIRMPCNVMSLIIEAAGVFIFRHPQMLKRVLTKSIMVTRYGTVNFVSWYYLYTSGNPAVDLQCEA